LEGDRGAKLIIRAASRGIIDYSQARPLDHLWWYKLKYILDEIEDEDRLKYSNMRFLLNLAVLDYSTEQRQFDHHWERASEILNRTYNQLFTWDKQELESTTQRYENLAQRWRDTFGDPKDPKVAADIQRTVDLMLGKVKVWHSPGKAP